MWHLAQLSDQFANLFTELQRTACSIAMPEWHFAGLTWCWGDQHAIVRNLFDPPSRCAEKKCIAQATFKDHLLIEFSDAGASLFSSQQEDTIEFAVGNGTAIYYGQRPGALPCREQVLHPVPRESWTQIGKLIRRVSSGEHIEHAFKHRAT